MPEKKHDERAHSLRSPSKSGIYTRCPGAPRLWEKVSDGGSSPAARLGTAKHTLAEWCHTGGVTAEDFLGQTIEVEGETFEIDEQFAQDVQSAVDMAWEMIGPDDGQMFLEMEVALDDLVGPGEAGHTDMAYVSEAREMLWVLDNKFGRKVVPAIDNSSLLLYAWGVVKSLGLRERIEDWTVVLGILQPVAGSPKGWTMSGKVFMEEIEKLRAKCALTYQDNAPLNLGDHCFFCQAKAICPEMAKQTGSMVFDDPEFEDLDAPKAPSEFAPEDVAKVLPVLNVIEKWVEEFKDYWLGQWREGVDIPGWKVAPGRKGARQWTSKNEVEDLMANTFRIPSKEMYSKSLITPAAAEKLLAEKSPRRWAQLEGLVKQSQSKPSFVPADHGGPTLERVTDLFE